MKWKYFQSYYFCDCDLCEKLENDYNRHGHKGRYMKFTCLTPIFNPITAEDYYKYHENIDFVLNRLKAWGFDNFHVMLYSHNDITLEDIQKRLQTEEILL